MATCKICGKEFEPPKKLGRNPSACSCECHCILKSRQLEKKRERARQVARDKIKNEIGQEYICAECGEVFIKHHANQKYCSKDCYRKHESKANRVYSVGYHKRHANASRSHELINKGITPFKDIIAQCEALGLSYGQLEDMKHRGVL